MSKEITRRQFCALGLAGAAMAITGGLGTATAYAEEAGEKARAIGDGAVNFSREVDVLIVGAGIPIDTLEVDSFGIVDDGGFDIEL